MSNNKPQVIVIIGPTASGKTSLAIKIANDFNGEIINADAFQNYAEMKIGTARATDDERKQAIFHLDGEISITDKWDIKKFQEVANELIAQIINKNKIPIIVGGSHMYVDVLIYNYDLRAPVRNGKYDDKTAAELYDLLLKKDIELAKKIANNKKRLARALEIIDSGNIINKKNDQLYTPLFIECTVERDKLYKKINDRVDLMFKAGWKDEVVNIMNKYKDFEKMNACKAIGYIDIINAINNKTSINIDHIKQLTRNYAKRQLTWIKHHYNNQLKFNNNYDEIKLDIKKWLKK